MGFPRKLGKQGEKASKNGSVPHSEFASFFRFMAANLSLTHRVTGGQASVVCIPHRVFLLRVRKNPFNRLLALRIKLFRTLRFP